MSRLLVVFGSSVLLGAALVYGCGDDDLTLSPKPDSGAASIFDTTPEAGVPEAAAVSPPPPALGVQIMRVGRPLIDVALNHVFDPDASTQAAAQAEYNANADAGAWSAYVPEIAKNLAVYDALDRTCGNQAFADGDAGAARYVPLATLLADDRLWLDTRQTTCTVYLAVETDAGHADAGDCGGRMLADDVVDGTYDLVSGSTSLTDGVGADPAKTSGGAFPYLVAPQH